MPVSKFPQRDPLKIDATTGLPIPNAQRISGVIPVRVVISGADGLAPDVDAPLATRDERLERREIDIGEMLGETNVNLVALMLILIEAYQLADSAEDFRDAARSHLGA